ncbi:MAG: viuB 1 [Rhodoglobus sp.]|nr:viuB 1 [Rhodoglobus sp.]
MKVEGGYRSFTGWSSFRALEAVKNWALPPGRLSAYLVGEQGLATGARRWLVNELGVPKKAILFSGYWKIGVSN